MKKIKKLSLVFACLIFVGVTNAFAGTDAAAFLKKSVGVKAIGMGGAYTSLADDTSAIYWNPAGLAQIQDYYSVYAMGGTGASDEYPGLKDVVPTHQFFAASIPYIFNINDSSLPSPIVDTISLSSLYILILKFGFDNAILFTKNTIEDNSF